MFHGYFSELFLLTQGKRCLKMAPVMRQKRYDSVLENQTDSM